MKKVLAMMCAVILVAICSISAFAAPSSEAAEKYPVNSESYATGTSKPTTNYTYGTDENGNTTITFVSDPTKTDDFKGWVINGEYEIVSGDLNSNTLVIRPASPIGIAETYNVNVVSPDVEQVAPEAPVVPTEAPTEKPTTPSGGTSPATGDTVVYGAMALVLVAAAAVVVMKKTSKSI